MMSTIETRPQKAPEKDTPMFLESSESLSSEVELSNDLENTTDTEDQQSTPEHPSYLWTSIGNGSYNRVWKSNFTSPTTLVMDEPYEGPWVLKYPIVSDNPVSNEMNKPSRAVRLWNEINSHLPKAGLHKLGWVAPFIPNTRKATDKEAAQRLIDIYCEQRRIVLDAATEGNFLTRTDTNEVILVDVDLALKRRGSFASLEYAKNLENRFTSYWLDTSLRKEMPTTLEATRNLLYLEDQLFVSIDELCKEKLVTLQNVLSLTWLRKHKHTLSLDLFKHIAVLNEADMFDEMLLEALVNVESQYLGVQKTKPKPSPELFKGLQKNSFFNKNSDGKEQDSSHVQQVRGDVEFERRR